MSDYTLCISLNARLYSLYFLTRQTVQCIHCVSPCRSNYNLLNNFLKCQTILCISLHVKLYTVYPLKCLALHCISPQMSSYTIYTQFSVCPCHCHHFTPTCCSHKDMHECEILHNFTKLRYNHIYLILDYSVEHKEICKKLTEIGEMN